MRVKISGGGLGYVRMSLTELRRIEEQGSGDEEGMDLWKDGWEASERQQETLKEGESAELGSGEIWCEEERYPRFNSQEQRAEKGWRVVSVSLMRGTESILRVNELWGLLEVLLLLG